MLLDRIDIDEHGPLNRVELGPLGEQLNVVFAPIGSGKTAIARFIRDTLVDRQYPTGMLSSSTGRVVWATRSGLVHCHREQDGTRQGRQRVHFEPRGATDPHYDSVQSAWLDSIASSKAMHRSLDAIELPESMVDGVITDTAVTNVAKVVAACLRHGLDQPATYRSLPMVESTVESIDADQREHLRAEMASVDAELARIGEIEGDHQTLVARRHTLSSQLSGWYDNNHPATPYRAPANYDQLQRSSNDLNARARQLRTRQTELRSWIADLERQFETRRAVGDATVDLNEQLVRSRRNLSSLTAELDACLASAADVRRSMRCTDGRSSWMDRDAVVAELRRIDDRLAAFSRRDWLLTRQNQLRRQLGQHTVAASPSSPVTALASQWLVRISGGRLNRIDWTVHESVRGNTRHQHRVSVRINGRPEADYASADRAISALAVRLAAGQLLARTGRHVPLVVETQREMWQTQHRFIKPQAAAYFQPGDQDRSNHPLVAALHDYAASGCQVVVLTSDQPLVMELSRIGARHFDIHPRRIVHGYQPLWRPHYEPESYIGPHPHVSGQRDVEPVSTPVHVRPSSFEDINRDFDLASFHALDVEQVPMGHSQRSTAVDVVTPEKTDWASDDVDHRDGYYYADTYTTVGQPVAKPASCCHCGTTTSETDLSVRKPQSPFLLSVDSPIDQAPSIDAVAAARLRGLNVTHVTHLMQQDANRLADALGLATVDAGTVRRWQAESRLCCRVPQLRNFNARILVGCGITTPAQLAAIHPTDLLQDVEAYLSTEQGQRILHSGSSQELSRITTWIATANSGVDGAVTLNGEVVRRDGRRTSSGTSSDRSRLATSGRELDRDRYEVDSESSRSGRRSRRGSRRSRSATARNDRSTEGRSRGTSNRRRSDSNSGTGSRRQRRVIDSEPQTSSHTDLNRRQHIDADDDSQRDVVRYDARGSQTSWKFYLERESPIEDAPSIGSRMAERLGAVEIYTVDDLLNADPDAVAEQLNHRRVDADMIVEWQQQATLVCCVPMLRGHDAQLLVAVEVTTPEELAASDAEELFAIVDPISRSSQGKRIIRGGKRPDLAEVTDWVNFAQHTRELRVA